MKKKSLISTIGRRRWLCSDLFLPFINTDPYYQSNWPVRSFRNKESTTSCALLTPYRSQFLGIIATLNTNRVRDGCHISDSRKDKLAEYLKGCAFVWRVFIQNLQRPSSKRSCEVRIVYWIKFSHGRRVVSSRRQRHQRKGSGVRQITDIDCTVECHKKYIISLACLLIRQILNQRSRRRKKRKSSILKMSSAQQRFTNYTYYLLIHQLVFVCLCTNNKLVIKKQKHVNTESRRCRIAKKYCRLIEKKAYDELFKFKGP